MREWEAELRSPQLFYVLLDANKRNYSKVVDTVRGLPGVMEIHNVTGDYNILVKVYGDDVESHAMRFQKNVKDLPGVRAVKTLIPTAF
jgi:DNA-binding Lrp family transcriptional regulator